MKRLEKKRGVSTMARKCTTLITIICLLLTSFSTAFGAGTAADAKVGANDLAGHWAEKQITEW